jgi:DNA-binding Xre family transcriptional regulator
VARPHEPFKVKPIGYGELARLRVIRQEAARLAQERDALYAHRTLEGVCRLLRCRESDVLERLQALLADIERAA